MRKNFISYIKNRPLLIISLAIIVIYILLAMFAPIIVPPLAVWIAVTWGWRWVFFSFAIPGIVAAVAWYLLVKSTPAESGFGSGARMQLDTPKPTMLRKR